MALHDSAFVAAFPIQMQIVDKDTGLPLADGSVGFYSDSEWAVPKAIYQQDQQSPFGFSELVNPVTLTSIGTFGDDNGTDIIPFLFPYNSTPEDTNLGAIQPYYIRVLSSDGVEQFTRSQWPPNLTEASNASDAFSATENQIANPQFVEVLFAVDPATGTYAYTVASGTTTVQIAPDWYIVVVTTGAGTITLSQDALGTPNAAPYALNVNSSGLITSLKLYQRMVHSPRLMAGDYVNGYVSVASVGSAGEVPITLTYVPSDAPTGTSYEFASDSTTSDGAFTAITGTVLVPGVDEILNAATATTGYMDFVIGIEPLKRVLITNAQMISVEDAAEEATFIQQSTARQIDHLFHYYEPKLIYKPVPSYLVGWDFPLNPYQANGTSSQGPNASGQNTSHYVADQTILFQSVTSGFTTIPVSTGAFRGLKITASATSSFGLIQYLTGPQVMELLTQRMSVQILCQKTGANLIGNVGLYYTADAAVPVITSGGGYLSLFTSITAGVPALTSNWVAVPTLTTGQAFTVTTTSGSTPFSFNGFDATAVAAVIAGTPANFAIGITFNDMTAGDALTINYCSLVGGDIATRPAPQTASAVLRDCQYYYQSSFPYGTGPAAGIGGGGIHSMMSNTIGGNQRGPSYTYPVPLRTNPYVSPGIGIVLYNPVTAVNNQVRNLTAAAADWSGCSIDTSDSVGFSIVGTSAGAAFGLLAVHFASDARLGVI